MARRPELEQRVQAAVRAFAKAINSGGNPFAVEAALIDATSRIPLSKLDDWERLIRWEFATALRQSPRCWWKPRARPKRSPTWIDLCSEDGYSRERTLRALSFRFAQDKGQALYKSRLLLNEGPKQ